MKLLQNNLLSESFTPTLHKLKNPLLNTLCFFIGRYSLTPPTIKHLCMLWLDNSFQLFLQNFRGKPTSRLFWSYSKSKRKLKFKNWRVFSLNPLPLLNPKNLNNCVSRRLHFFVHSYFLTYQHMFDSTSFPLFAPYVKKRWSFLKTPAIPPMGVKLLRKRVKYTKRYKTLVWKFKAALRRTNSDKKLRRTRSISLRHLFKKKFCFFSRLLFTSTNQPNLPKPFVKSFFFIKRRRIRGVRSRWRSANKFSFLKSFSKTKVNFLYISPLYRRIVRPFFFAYRRFFRKRFFRYKKNSQNVFNFWSKAALKKKFSIKPVFKAATFWKVIGEEDKGTQKRSDKANKNNKINPKEVSEKLKSPQDPINEELTLREISFRFRLFDPFFISFFKRISRASIFRKRFLLTDKLLPLTGFSSWIEKSHLRPKNLLKRRGRVSIFQFYKKPRKRDSSKHENLLMLRPSLRPKALLKKKKLQKRFLTTMFKTSYSSKNILTQPSTNYFNGSYLRYRYANFLFLSKMNPIHFLAVRQKVVFFWLRRDLMRLKKKVKKFSKKSFYGSDTSGTSNVSRKSRFVTLFFRNFFKKVFFKKTPLTDKVKLKSIGRKKVRKKKNTKKLKNLYNSSASLVFKRPYKNFKPLKFLSQLSASSVIFSITNNSLVGTFRQKLLNVNRCAHWFNCSIYNLNHSRRGSWNDLFDKTMRSNFFLRSFLEKGFLKRWVFPVTPSIKRLELSSSYQTNFRFSNIGFLFLRSVNLSLDSEFCYNSTLIRARINTHRLSFFFQNDLKRMLMRRPGFVKLINSFRFKSTLVGFDFFNPNDWLFRNQLYMPRTSRPNKVSSDHITTNMYRVRTIERFLIGTENFELPEEVSIKRIRFKPGYQRFWRRARSSLNYVAGYNYRYQVGLTRRVSRLRKLGRGDSLRSRELILSKIILSSRFVFDKNAAHNLICSNLSFVNGVSTNNPKLKIFVGDFIQLVIHNKYYIIYRWLLNWNSQYRTRFIKLSRHKTNSSHSDLSKQVSTHLPNWIFNISYRVQDIPSFLEVDFFTLSSFVIYEPLDLSDYHALTFFSNRPEILPMYNWKYIN